MQNTAQAAKRTSKERRPGSRVVQGTSLAVQVRAMMFSPINLHAESTLFNGVQRCFQLPHQHLVMVVISLLHLIM